MNRLLAGAQRELALRCLLAGGDDYELCFTVPQSREAMLGGIARDLGLGLARIGSISEAAGIVVRDEFGHALATLPRGFDHFAP